MFVYTSDFETTRFPEGSPFSSHLKAVCVGIKQDEQNTKILFLSETPLPSDFLDPSGLHIFFNAKFDLHWYRRLKVTLPTNVWCCQLAHYYLTRQKATWNSLNEVAEYYSLPTKLDVVKTEYWDKNIDTDAIPQDILSTYCIYDVDLTYAIYLRQQAAFVQHPGLYRLFKLACQDLLILEEVESNGIAYDAVLCASKRQACEKDYQTILAKLSNVYPEIPINFNSTDQLSAFLYGGTITQEVKKPIGFYKTGAKKGQVKFGNFEVKHLLPRLIEPLPKSQLAKPGLFSTDEGTLKKLKGPNAKKYVEDLLHLAKLDKLLGTYYRGIPELNKSMSWPAGMVYGQFNQVATGTTRLSSSKPNLQNFADDILDIFVSRYND